MKNNTDGALERLSWIYSNSNDNISQTINQDQLAKVKRIEDKQDKDEFDEVDTQDVSKIRGEAGDERRINVQHGRTATGETKSDSNDTTFLSNDSNLTPDAFPVNNSQTYIGLISAALTVIAFFSSCTIFLMKQRGRNKVALLQKHTALLCGSPAPGITINTKDMKLPTPIVVNSPSKSRLSFKSKIASNSDYKFGDVDASEQHSACEKINKVPTEQYIKCEARPSYKTEHFGMWKILLIATLMTLIICATLTSILSEYARKIANTRQIVGKFYFIFNMKNDTYTIRVSITT